MKNPQLVVDSNFDRAQARRGLTAKNQSQMTKLLPILQLSGKKGPEPEQVIAKLETRAVKLKELKVKLDKTNVSLSKLYVVERDQQLKKLSANLKKIKAILEEGAPIGVSKHLKACLNELTSLREGVYTGAELDEEGATVLTVAEAVTHVTQLIASNKKTIARTKAEMVGASVEDDESYYADVTKVLAATQQQSQNLDGLKTRPFVVARAPVIPMAKSGLNPTKLQQQGFKTDNMAGYPVMHNQLVLGINKSMLELKDKEKSKSIKSDRVFAEALKVKAVIEKQTKQKLFFVDEKPHGASGGSWFWLMPEREINAFAKAFPDRHVSLLRFGFAF
jgi:hypothetical protein